MGRRPSLIRLRRSHFEPCPCRILTIVEGKSKKRFIRDFLGGDDLSATCDRGISSTKMHIRIHGIPACGPYKQLPPMQTRVIPALKANTGGSDALCLGAPPVPD
jgi:hypothetical protein